MHTYFVYPSNCSGSILSDHDGLATDGVPLVQFIGQLGWYGLRMTWVIVPTIVAVESNDINKLCLERGERKKGGGIGRKEEERNEKKEEGRGRGRRERKRQGRGRRKSRRWRENKWVAEENRMATSNSQSTKGQD